MEAHQVRRASSNLFYSVKVPLVRSFVYSFLFKLFIMESFFHQNVTYVAVSEEPMTRMLHFAFSCFPFLCFCFAFC